MRLLILEDRRADADLAVASLAAAGVRCEAIIVDTRHAFIEALAAGPEAVIADYVVPGFGAVEATKLVTARLPYVPVIVVSGRISDEEAAAIIRDGASDFVPKDHLERLADGLRSALAEMRLRRERAEAQALLQRVVDGTRSAIVAVAPDGTISLANTAVTQMTGFSPGALVGTRFLDAFRAVEGSPMAAALERAMAGEEDGTFETEIVGPDGSTRTLVGRLGTLTHDGAATGVVVSAEDVTTQRELEGRLRQAAKMEAVGQLAGGIAHDFNNLLTIIIGLCSLVQEQLEDADPEVREDVAQVALAAERAAGLTRQLLTFSRRHETLTETIDAAAHVAEMVPILERLVGADIALEARLAHDAGMISIDPTQLSQILINLAANARDAMPDGGRLTVEARRILADGRAPGPHVGRPSGAYLMLAASDTGEGMDEATQERVYEPFFTTKEIGKGTGLGLSTVYGIVTDAGGHLSLRSEVGRGTTFEIYLPLVAEEVAVA
ncbi:MAG TPA: ATP-binding protein [Candidatus Limnocylindrales bacterium]|nr:ATP-binding protein [Candidatus Limnocylindrales bacterium]